MTERIDRFRGEYDFLSNFHVIPDWREGQLWAHCRATNECVRVASVEHGYQATKARSFGDFLDVCLARTPAEAKALGNRIKLRADWEGIKDAVMYALVRAKFRPQLHPTLARLLDYTDDAELIEGNDWRDDYWGVYRGRGQNKLGKILMRVREENRRR